MKLNVISEIVESDLCIGCGVCAGVCPQEVLKMRDNKYGEYIPYETQKCHLGCGICLEVCPFNNNENETQIGAKIYGTLEGIKYLPEVGHYFESYVGYSNNFRNCGASGGITTWILTKLIKKDIVDYIICVSPQGNPDKLFDFEIFNDKEQISKSSGSVYYPVEMSRVIRKILEIPGRYAITGLPCFLKALRLAIQRNKILRERIIVTVGLVCGQLKNKQYTTHLSSLANVKGKLKKVSYREKNSERSANNYYFYCMNENKEEGRISSKEGSLSWANRWFTLNACNFCDDTFAELADITLMDAWLPEYIHDGRGTNLFVVRSFLINEIIKEGIIDGDINADVISINKVVQSQLGVLETKRKLLPYRLFIEQKNGSRVPIKRLSPAENIGYFEKREIELKIKMQKKSKKLFIENYNGCQLNARRFNQKLFILIKETTLLKLAYFLIYKGIFIKRKKNSYL